MGNQGNNKHSIIWFIAAALIAVGCAPVNNETASALTSSTSGITVSASATTLSFSQSETISASGGTAPYTYSIQNGNSSYGTINSSTGLFTAGTTNTTVQIAAEDSTGLYGYLTLTIGTGSTSTTGLTISPSTYTMAVGGSISFAVSGGSGNYSYTMTGVGQLSSSTYFGTAAGTATITASDEDNTSLTAVATVTVTGSSTGLSVSPANPTVTAGQSVVLTPSGGTPPYSFGIVSGSGTFSTTTVASGSSTTYTSPGNATGSIELSLTDSAGNVDDFYVTLGTATSSNPVSATFTMTIADYFGITYDNTNDYPSGAAYTSDTPKFWVWGATNGGASGVGANGSSSNYLPLVNYSNAAMSALTYRGYFTVTTATVTSTINYCIPPAATSGNSLAAYVLQSGGATGFFEQQHYNATNEYIAAGQLLDAFFVQADTASSAESASVYFVGEFTSNTDCSDFTSNMYVEVL